MLMIYSEWHEGALTDRTLEGGDGSNADGVVEGHALQLTLSEQHTLHAHHAVEKPKERRDGNIAQGRVSVGWCIEPCVTNDTRRDGDGGRPGVFHDEFVPEGRARAGHLSGSEFGRINGGLVDEGAGASELQAPLQIASEGHVS